MKIRKPDDVAWAWREAFCLGVAWSYQRYHFSATCLTIWIGPLTVRWHKR